MPQNTRVGYKQKLLRVSEMLRMAREALYQRVSLLVEVFEDVDFRAESGAADDFALAEILDAYLEDTALSFLEARAVFEKFPQPESWEGKTVRDLYAEASRKPEAEPTGRTRRAATVAELDAANERAKEFESRLKYSESNQARMRDELDELRVENQRLLCENAKLEGRIVELERSLERVVIRDRQEQRSC